VIVVIEDTDQGGRLRTRVRAAPRTRLEADRESDPVVLKPLAARPAGKSRSIVDSLPVVEGRPADPRMTFRREDIYGPDAAR
jgi:hypothetical protein